MGFLIKSAFWLTIVLVLLPSGTPSSRKSDISAGEAMSAAQATVDDMRQFCSRQPGACSIGGEVLAHLTERVQAGARFALEFLSETKSETKTAAPALLRGTIDPASEPGQHTLTQQDLMPGWRGSDQRQHPQPPRRAY